MKVSHFPISTLRETPADAEIKSHQLMLKAGMIKRVSSGLYTWAPFGLKVMRKVENIVREELNKAGLVELLMPTVQPAELWEESGRWEQFGPELLTLCTIEKNCPVTYYQIQTKFRDEVRPRFGVMRSREFVMKDGYSFHSSQESLQETYDIIHQAYTNIFNRMGLKFRPVLADSGAIGGSTSHEFHVLADSGEDAIAFSNESDYAANIELAVALPPEGERPAPTEEMQTVDTPDSHTIDAVSAFLNKPAETSLKTLIVEGEEEGEVVAILMQGNDQLNELKAEKIDGIGSPLTPATEEQLLQAGVNWGRDLPEPQYVDVRNVTEGDPSPDGKGITRVVAASIEQNHDDNGIIWPAALAPFQLSIVPINYNKSEEVKAQADALYEELISAGYDVLLDDRNMRPGAMFADHELLGIPHRIVISDRGLKEGQVEFKSRTESDASDVQRADIMQFVADKLS
ncbi:Proline--tRNA ligase [Nymphon striatum]|nr:Proline--tRNA ligase [Nymphon striatum]